MSEENEPAVDAVEPEENRALHGSTMRAEEPAAVEPEPEPVAVVEEPKPKARVTNNAVATHVVSGKDKDDVFVKNAVYKNPRARKSLTVHHIQRRLAELGYGDAAADRDGWYGDLTKLAVEGYQKDNRLTVTGLMDVKTMEALFAGDPNVRVVAD